MSGLAIAAAVLAAVLAVALGITAPAHAKKTKEECKSIKPEHELKMVTLAPAGSEWSKQFSKWSDDALEETDCKVQLKWYFNAPNEPGILDDLRSGAKHGAAMTANVICYRGRSAAREIGKVLGFDEESTARLSSMVPLSNAVRSDLTFGQLKSKAFNDCMPDTFAKIRCQ